MHQIIIIGFSLFVVLVNSHNGHEITTIWSQRALVEEDNSNETYSDSASGMGSDDNTSELPSSSLHWLFPSFRNLSKNCTSSSVETEQRSNSLDGQESSTNWPAKDLAVTEESATDMSNSTQMNPTQESAVITSDKSTVSPAEIIMKWLMSFRNSSETIQRNNSFLEMIKRSNDENPFKFDNIRNQDNQDNGFDYLNEIPRRPFESGMDNFGMNNFGMGSSGMENSGMENLGMNNFGLGNGFPQMHASSTESSLSAHHNSTQSSGWFQWLFGR